MHGQQNIKVLMKLKFSRQIFEKHPKAKVHKNPVQWVLSLPPPTHRKVEA